MNIRIGNDVKLTLTLRGDAGEPLNILSAQAYISNHSAKEEALRERKRVEQFYTRFPIGKDAIFRGIEDVEPDDHNIHMLGEVPYNCYPRTYYENKKYGFGLYPNWDKKYIPVIEEYALTSYNTPVSFTSQRGVVEVTYPAEAQYITGDYDVVIVARVYDPGYRPDNSKIVTTVFNKQFTLVPNEVLPDLMPPTIVGDIEFEESTQVSMTAEEGTQIRYTTDGTMPVDTSIIYSSPITIYDTTTIKAIAIKESQTSALASKTFTKVEPEPEPEVEE